MGSNLKGSQALRVRSALTDATGFEPVAAPRFNPQTTVLTWLPLIRLIGDMDVSRSLKGLDDLIKHMVLRTSTVARYVIALIASSVTYAQKFI
ncbi:hypothetical protein ASD24_24795 [Paenibacillus sp. Root52]|nr:hypothetical protein ASD24_24795 [Paenibacillus sp. Root52]